MDKRFLGILGAIIVIFIAIFAITSGGGSPSSNNSGAKPTSHIEGQGKSGITLIEYGDYECPICEAYYLPLKQVYSQLSSQIYFQFRNLPLSPNPHPNAFTAARAAEAAALQDKFWQMHDKLYEGQNDWANAANPQSFFNQYAQQIGLNVDKFKTDFVSSQVNDSINADLSAFAKTNREKATPTFFLDGKYVDNTSLTDSQTGAPDIQKITAAIQAEINSKSK